MPSGSQNMCLPAMRRALEGLGYKGSLLESDYSFRDYFTRSPTSLTVDLAAFGQTPPSYATACIAVVISSGKSGRDIARDCRSLCAPIVFEVGHDRVVPWRVSRNITSDNRLPSFQHDQIETAFATHAEEWSPTSILRAKNAHTKERQLDFVDIGLLPALEEHITQKLDPLLNDAVTCAKESFLRSAGREPHEEELFKAAFWLLAAKVFHDRKHARFVAFSADSLADDVLAHVGDHYGETIPRRLLNQTTRQALHSRIWSSIDFTHLSVEVLAEIWANTLVTPELRKTLGIHTTPRAVAKFVVDHLPFESIPVGERYVVEPCCGSARFLIAALQRLRMLLPPNWDGEKRHHYFAERLTGYDRDSFGIEISRLSLTLADYPNPNGWQLFQEDVFNSDRFANSIRQARIVLCNPPFEDMRAEAAMSYSVATPRQPAALLESICDLLHPKALLGFVLPRKFLDGQSYRSVRTKLAAHFSDIELVCLPEKAFAHSNVDTVLLIAKGPSRRDQQTRVTQYKVDDSQWQPFKASLEATETGSASITPARAAQGLFVPDMPDVWKALESHPRVAQVASIHRGIEWNKPIAARTGVSKSLASRNHSRFIHGEESAGFQLGVPPQAKIVPFVQPELRYLSLLPQHARGNAYLRDWSSPKVIVNKARRSRGKWRLTAFADRSGITCYQAFYAIWPLDDLIEVEVLAAFLNGPVANAFVTSHMQGRDIPKTIIGMIPIPRLAASQREDILALIRQLHTHVEKECCESVKRTQIEIDAAVTRPYELSVEHERCILRYFSGSNRLLPLNMTQKQYFPDSLADGATFDELLSITKNWNDINWERCQLIRKEVSGKLTEDEQAKLAHLQHLADMRLQAFAPLPMKALEQALEELNV